MEPTVSDPGVQQQWGMRVGIPDAGGVNAIETLNIRGERSVTCKARCDAATGALPASCPKACDAFRQATRRARARGAARSSSTARIRISRSTRCIASRSSGRTGTTRPICAAPAATTRTSRWMRRNTIRPTSRRPAPPARSVSRWPTPRRPAMATTAPRSRRATSSATISRTPRGAASPAIRYDTERVPRGSSSGSGVAVAANLGACSFCEQSGGSCMGPASRNGIVSILTTKGMLMDGGYGYQSPGDRAGIYCRTVADAVKVLDVVKGFETTRHLLGAAEGDDPEGALHELPAGRQQRAVEAACKGMRIAIVREFMVKHAKNDAAISDQIDKEIKASLRDKLGAELVESVDPLYPDDPSVPNLKYTFQDAIREIFPANVPEYFCAEERGRRARVRGAGLGRDVGRLSHRARAGQGAAVSEAVAAAHVQVGEPRGRLVSAGTCISAAAATSASRTGRAGCRTRSSTASRRSRRR